MSRRSPTGRLTHAARAVTADIVEDGRRLPPWNPIYPTYPT